MIYYYINLLYHNLLCNIIILLHITLTKIFINSYELIY